MELEETYVPIHTIARDPTAARVVDQWDEGHISRMVADYCREPCDRVVIVRGDQIVYGDYVVECLLRRDYSEIRVVLEDVDVN